MIHILLPVHNRASVTTAFAQSLARQTITDYTLFLIDDGCNDDTVARVRDCIAAAQLVVMRGNGNLWWAGALQLGYDALLREGLPDTDAVLIINDDVAFASDFLARGVEVLAERPDAAIQAVGVDAVTGTVDSGTYFSAHTLRFRSVRPGETPNCLATRGLIMSARTFKRSGGFRPDKLPHYLSDYEFTFRLHRMGVALATDPRFLVTVRPELTGGGRYRRSGFRAFWDEAFSNRAKYNPLHTSAFAMMACPPAFVPLHLLRIWLRFGLAALRSLAGPAT